MTSFSYQQMPTFARKYLQQKLRLDLDFLQTQEICTISIPQYTKI